ncbi:putative cytochrome p450 [Lyophyllum shimeji]|uniref:Cytochrome p450 n=1 Tax=Lyophyllum shimeji TaxID=47721 RepID=A0A9P3PT11_LYOSH|nr:putative cytochrome p450 [Lyophyllum shimeji]
MLSLVTRDAYGLFLLGFAVIFVSYKFCRRRRGPNPQGLPFPPGPRPLPLVGNLFDLARVDEVEAYLRLYHKYGDLVFFNALGKKILFVNTFQAANDLFEKRSANYSDRNHSPMLHELMGWDWTFGHMPYGERWKAHRRMFHRQFQQSVAHIHWPVQRKEAHSLMRRLLDSPDNLMEHLRHNAASVIMNVTYGIKIVPKNDRYITIAEKALAGMAEAANPGAFLVDLIPFLKHIPEWVPGAGFQRKAREWKDAVYEMRDAPFEAVTAAIKEGTASPSFVSNLVSELEAGSKDSLEKNIELVKACAGMAYAGGTESTLSALSSFVLAVILHPEVQAKGREELDRVLGHSRLPDFPDWASLPYVSAIVKEVLRWSPVAPLGLPHMATNDDEYRGCFIPAGTTIVGNTWAILHDPITFPDPSVFNPDRFLSANQQNDLSPLDPLSVAFGYGRRICPGRYMAEAQLWISIACMLALFDIGCGVDEMGRPMPKPEMNFTSGLIRHPMPFKFSIRPRGEWARTLLEQAMDGD